MMTFQFASMILSSALLTGWGPPPAERWADGGIESADDVTMIPAPDFSGTAWGIQDAPRIAADLKPKEAGDEPEKADPAHALLDRLETAAADLESFTAEIIYENWDDLLTRREIRQGEIIYQIDSETDAKNFAILFGSLTVNQRRQTRLRHYVFRDRWLAEIDHEAKQFIKRELVPPGRQLDPLKLGEGPVPLPIGQPKDEVLKRFEATLIDPPGDELALLRGLVEVDGLRLTPREGSPEARDYRRIDLYYDRATSLPVGINVIEVNGNRKTVRLRNMQRNPKLTDEQVERLSIDEPDPREWSIDIRPLN